MGMRSRHRRQGGFTLVELLVALMVFAIMAVMAYGGLESVLNTRADVTAALDRTRMLQLAYFRAQRDFSQLRHRPIRNAYGDEQADFQLHTGTNRLEFTRGGWANPLSQRRATLQRVEYALEKNQLVRYSWVVLDRAPDSKPRRTILATGVTALRWRFMGSNHQWHDTPPADNAVTATQTPPLAVEMRLQTRDWGALRYVFLLDH